MSSVPLGKNSRKSKHRTPTNGNAPAIAGRVVPDQLEVSGQDLHWLRVAWEIGRASLDRAAAALGTDWHRAVAVLRLSDVTGNDHSRGTPRIVGEIELPAGPTSWFVRVEQPDRTYRVTLGFRARSGRFHQIIQSRPINPARASATGRHAARPATHVEDADGWPLDLYAGRCHVHSDANGNEAKTAPVVARAANGSEPTAAAIATHAAATCPLHVEAELIVRGGAAADARVALLGKSVTLTGDGHFCQRVPLQAGRQVVPVVATAGDRSEERTVVIALELSLRELEPRLFGDL